MTLLALTALIGAVRVFSADYCADQLVLALADPAQIAALSVDAGKDFSYLRAKAGTLPRARSDAEQIIGADADVVLRFWGGDAARLKQFGIPVISLGYAADFDAVKDNVRVAAEALQREVEGKTLIADIDARLAALAARGKTKVAALYVTPGGVTAGKGTMIDAIFTAAGVSNIAADKGLSYWPPLSAEALIANPPQFIVTGFFSADSERVNHWSAARHPALQHLLEATPRIDLAADVLACPGWFALEAAEAIRAEVDKPKDKP